MGLPDFPVEGGCQCGRVRYRLTAAPLSVYNCHCKDCQRFSGAGWTMSVPTPRDAVELISGTLDVYEKTADSWRVIRVISCGHCHTRLWNEPPAPADILVLRAGTLDNLDWAVPVGNIWTSSAVAWADIDPTLVNFEAQPPSREPLYAAWSAFIGKDA